MCFLTKTILMTFIVSFVSCVNTGKLFKKTKESVLVNPVVPADGSFASAKAHPSNQAKEQNGVLLDSLNSEELERVVNQEGKEKESDGLNQKESETLSMSLLLDEDGNTNDEAQTQLPLSELSDELLEKLIAYAENTPSLENTGKEVKLRFKDKKGKQREVRLPLGEVDDKDGDDISESFLIRALCSSPNGVARAVGNAFKVKNMVQEDDGSNSTTKNIEKVLDQYDFKPKKAIKGREGEILDKLDDDI